MLEMRHDLTEEPAPPQREQVLEQFQTAEQQHEIYRLGMWTFLASEVMLFGGMFLAYTVFRYVAFQPFAAASNHEDLFLGSVNTAVLIVSSLTMALAVDALEKEKRKACLVLLGITALLGIGFLCIKGLEYYQKFGEHLVPGIGFHLEGTTDQGHAQIFYFLYFVMTGTHAVHLTLGVLTVFVMIFLIWRKTEMVGGYIPLEMTGLYWHLVDVVWIFLYPCFYLVGRAYK
jgi:cytochrome c oxidase subunit 3